ncbi:MAG TPA: hypothetical protein PKD53_08590 [Chloroflexaceae bacterium]|nr:hypothetical protein [Chloroflexaceae bacterium]
MATPRPAGPPPEASPRPRLALPFAPACLPAPRAGTPVGWRSPAAPRLAPLPQRAPRELPLPLAAAGFPGLSLDQGRGVVARQAAERDLGRVGLAYLRAERAAGAPPAEQAAGVADALRQLDQATHAGLRGARAELAGPVSLALQLVDEQERPLAYEPALREALVQQVALRAAWLHDQLSAHGGAALVCLDEPFLEALGSPFAPLDYADGADLLAQALGDAPAPRGLCVAGTPSWPAVLALPADVIFFDAYEHGAGLIQAAGAVSAFLERGGALGWGVVPTEPAALAQERAATLARRFESNVEFLAAAGGIDPTLIRGAALISTSGGLAHLPPPLASQAAALCGEVSALLRAKYQLDQ